MFGCLPAKTPLTKSCSISTLVVWDAPLTITNCILKLEPRTKTLKRCNLRISIRQLAHASAGGYTRLGVITVDLAEYLGGNKITRSFLLEDSRLNSTLNITIHNEQVRGDVMFRWKTPNPVSTDVEGDETAQPEQGPVRQKTSSPPRLPQQQSALQAVEDIVRELRASRANTPTLQQDKSPA
ncbi:hypothetical protein PC122_g3589 [Phytophthora cactorum]|nr:hypothetical protein PC122_g3589 [Phytophthora cactorum]